MRVKKHDLLVRGKKAASCSFYQGGIRDYFLSSSLIHMWDGI